MHTRRCNKNENFTSLALARLLINTILSKELTLPWKLSTFLSVEKAIQYLCWGIMYVY
jgi:hypothetical protein